MKVCNQNLPEQEDTQKQNCEAEIASDEAELPTEKADPAILRALRAYGLGVLAGNQRNSLRSTMV